MKTSAILAKIEEATREMAAAEGDLDRLLREIRVAPRAEKTTISEVVQKAFAELRAARSKLVELQEDLIADDARE
jgi:hypothetical protein